LDVIPPRGAIVDRHARQLHLFRNCSSSSVFTRRLPDQMTYQ
jgi:hypothetical protein